MLKTTRTNENSKNGKNKWSIFFIILLSCLISTQSFAIDGKIYFGKYFDQTLRSEPSDGVAEYVAGVELGKSIKRFRFYTELKTLMDESNGDGTFHPSSIEYTIGSTVNLFDNLYLRIEHMCWHPIDDISNTEQYNLLQIEYKFGKK